MLVKPNVNDQDSGNQEQEPGQVPEQQTPPDDAEQQNSGPLPAGAEAHSSDEPEDDDFHLHFSHTEALLVFDSFTPREVIGLANLFRAFLHHYNENCGCPCCLAHHRPI